MKMSASIFYVFKYLIYIKFYESYRNFLQWLNIDNIRLKYNEEELELSQMTSYCMPIQISKFFYHYQAICCGWVSFVW